MPTTITLELTREEAVEVMQTIYSVCTRGSKDSANLLRIADNLFELIAETTYPTPSQAR